VIYLSHQAQDSAQQNHPFVLKTTGEHVMATISLKTCINTEIWLWYITKHLLCLSWVLQ